MQSNSVIMTNSSITEQSFRINLRVMRAFQLYPPENHTPLYKIKAYFVHFVFVMYIPILGILYLLLEEHLDMERVNYNAAFLAQVTAFSAKFLPIINNAHRIKKCITFFESSSFNITKAKHGNILDNCIQICRRNTRIFLVCVAVGVTNWATKPLFWEERNFPTDIWLPFNATSHITVYCCVYIYLATGNIVICLDLDIFIFKHFFRSVFIGDSCRSGRPFNCRFGVSCYESNSNPKRQFTTSE
jgi:hypothetical protein